MAARAGRHVVAAGALLRHHGCHPPSVCSGRLHPSPAMADRASPDSSSSEPYRVLRGSLWVLRRSWACTSSSAGPSSAAEGLNSEKEVEPEAVDVHTKILEGALCHVNRLGWSEAALAEAAQEEGLSPAVIGLFPRKEAELVEYFMAESAKKVKEDLDKKAEEWKFLPSRQRMLAAIKERLELQGPYVSSWPQALSIQAYPNNVAVSLRQRWELMDVLWGAVDDKSTELERHGKRLLLAGVYSAAEIYMLTDFSPGFEDTWRFVERQVDSVLELKKSVNEVSHLAQAVGAGLARTVNNLFKGQLPKGPFP